MGVGSIKGIPVSDWLFLQLGFEGGLCCRYNSSKHLRCRYNQRRLQGGLGLGLITDIAKFIVWELGLALKDYVGAHGKDFPP